MATNDQRSMTPLFPAPAEIDWQQVEYDYDQESDTIALHLFGFDRPSLVLHTQTDIDLLVDPTTSLVVGFQIEGFIAQVVHRDPQYLLLARNAGIDPEILARVERDIDPVARKRADFQILSDARLRTSA
jgi:hypothetical protein